MELTDLVMCTSLEDVRRMGLNKAQYLRNSFQRSQASYVLYLVEECYAMAREAVPPDIKELREKINDECAHMWGPKIQEALAKDDDELAARFFHHAIMGFYRHPKLPNQFYSFIEAIKPKARSQLARELIDSYTEDKFERVRG